MRYIVSKYISVVLLSLAIPKGVSATGSLNNIHFREKCSLLLVDHKENTPSIHKCIAEINDLLPAILDNKSHINITAFISNKEKSSPEAINLASVRASVIRAYLKDIYPALNNSHFVFEFAPQTGSKTLGVSVEETPISNPNQSNIYYTFSQNNNRIKNKALLYGNRLSLLKRAPLRATTSHSGIRDEKTDEVKMRIYYRFDKFNLDTAYISNATTLQKIDSLMRQESALYIDSLFITAHASPEGNPNYNRRLSQRRATTLRNYLINTYPNRINPQIVVIEAKGENWDEFRQMATKDPQLPMKSKVLSILNDATINDVQRQSQISRLDNGQLYKNYLHPNYYRYLRSGASLFMTYDRSKISKLELLPSARVLSVDTFKSVTPYLSIDSSLHIPSHQPTLYQYYRPLAIKSNLLFDLATIFNIEIEIPLSSNWSILGEWTFPWWLWNDQQYCLQLLQGNLEARYWFRPNYQKQEAVLGRHNPLTGWFVGAYAGAGYYDFEYNKRGFQGNLFTAGISCGYVLALNRNLNMEFSAGVGYMQTDFWNYEAKMDINDEWHLIKTNPGRITTFAIPEKNKESDIWLLPYRAKVSLIWYPHIKIKKKGGAIR